jgi:very-short-patch-repair endonuclease
MPGKKLQQTAVWDLVARQHGVVTRRQLLDLGLTAKEIEEGIRGRRLHPVWRGIYAAGRPMLSRKGRWLAAVLACGSGAALSHGSAGALSGIGEYELGVIEVSVPEGSVRRRPGIRIRRRAHLDGEDVTERFGIPVTSPVRTLLDLAPRLSLRQLEAAINEAANLDLVSPEKLRWAIEDKAGQRGVARLRTVLDRRTFRLTRSHLERLFLPIAGEAGLPAPETRVQLNGFEVDFYFRDIGLVVETDGLRYHRTPAQQARDRLRDQAHAAAGLMPVRFTHEQVRYEPAHVRTVLRAVAASSRRKL